MFYFFEKKLPKEALGIIITVLYRLMGTNQGNDATENESVEWDHH